MVRFRGLCSYPHGGSATAGFFLAVACALAATGYGVASCRLLSVTLSASSSSSSSSSGTTCWEDSFQMYTTDVSNPGASSAINNNGTASLCEVNLGLFQWRRPNNDPTSDWRNDGYCVGYSETMLDALTNSSQDDDIFFHVARSAGILSVLLSFVLLGWSFIMACLELNWIQMMLLRACSLTNTILTGLVLIMKQTQLCQSMLPSADNVECQLDQGGLAMITASILWLIALMITLVFMKSPSRPASCGPCRGKSKQPKVLTTPRTHRRLDQAASYSFDSTESWTKPIRKSRQARNQKGATTDIVATSVAVDDSNNPDELEVYISKRLDNIESLTNDEADGDDNHVWQRQGAP